MWLTPQCSMDSSVVPPLMKTLFLKKNPLLIENVFPQIKILLAAWVWGSEPWIPLLAPKPGPTASHSLSLSWDKPRLPESLRVFGNQGDLPARDGEVPSGGCPAPALPFLQLRPLPAFLSLLLFLSCPSPGTWEDQPLLTSLRSGRLL